MARISGKETAWLPRTARKVHRDLESSTSAQGRTLGPILRPSNGQLPWAVLQGFRDVGGADLVCACEVGDGSGEFDDAVMGAGGEVHLAGGGAHQLLTCRIQGTVLAHLVRPHVRVRDA